jgi:hypothetical protein
MRWQIKVNAEVIVERGEQKIPDTLVANRAVQQQDGWRAGLTADFQPETTVTGVDGRLHYSAWQSIPVVDRAGRLRSIVREREPNIVMPPRNSA